MADNKLYYGDNLTILREYVPDESVDLIYLDPPFNSNRNYNIIFKDESGQLSDAQIVAFEDTWHWGPSAESAYGYLTNTSQHGGRVADNVSILLDSLVSGLGKNQMTAYLVEMSVRLIELHRVLKPTGSVYLHCDPSASHYLKILMDAILGPENFRSEIVWKRTSAHSGSKRWGPVHDTILFYTKTNRFVWNTVLLDYSEEYIQRFYRYSDEKGRFRVGDLTGAGTRSGESGQPWRGVNPTAVGRHWAAPNKALVALFGKEAARWTVQRKLDALDKAGLIYWPAKGRVPGFKRYYDDTAGVPIVDVVTDINPLSAQSAERLGYPTQKPELLLERIIQASSNAGDTVLDPFCGCGTALVAAQKLGRQWIGIDIAYLAIPVIRTRLRDTFEDDVDFEIINRPTEVAGARQMVTTPKGRADFQWWAIDLIGATPVGGVRKMGADRGIDGKITFTEADGRLQTVLVSVKGGHVNPGMVRDLRGTVEREQAAIGMFLTLEEPTAGMREEAVQAGLYHSELWNRDYPHIQIITIREILDEGKQPDLPAFRLPTYQQAPRAKPTAPKTDRLI